jgi:hypothetical protein
MTAVLIKLPEVPVIVTFTVPAGAVLLAANVNVLVPVVLFGLNDAVTPLGRLEADKLTLLLNPFCGATVIVLAPLAPGAMLKLLGDADSVKLAMAVTVSATEVVLTKLPEVPVIVTFTVPAGAVLLAANVNVLVPVVLFGLNDAVTPLGRPEADKLTLLLKPFCGATVIVLVPLVPGAMLKLPGEADKKKLGPEPGQLFTRLATLTVPIPVEKSQPVFVP